MKQPCTLLPAERSHINQAPDSTMGSNASFYATWSAAFDAKDEKAIAALYQKRERPPPNFFEAAILAFGVWIWQVMLSFWGQLHVQHHQYGCTL